MQALTFALLCRQTAQEASRQLSAGAPVGLATDPFRGKPHPLPPLSTASLVEDDRSAGALQPKAAGAPVDCTTSPNGRPLRSNAATGVDLSGAPSPPPASVAQICTGSYGVADADGCPRVPVPPR